MTGYVAGLDLGQAGDFTALAVAKLTLTNDHCRPMLDVVHLRRYELGTPYPAIVADVSALMERRELHPEGGQAPALVIDSTGVGRPVVDMFTRVRLAATVHPLTITTGDRWRREGRSYWVPKKDLAGAVQAGLQSGALKVVPALTLAETLKAELLNFRVKITAAANETFGAWRENQHDDLVLAVGMVVWFACHPPPVLRFFV